MRYHPKVKRIILSCRIGISMIIRPMDGTLQNHQSGYRMKFDQEDVDNPDFPFYNGEILIAEMKGDSMVLYRTDDGILNNPERTPMEKRFATLDVVMECYDL